MAQLQILLLVAQTILEVIAVGLVFLIALLTLSFVITLLIDFVRLLWNVSTKKTAANLEQESVSTSLKYTFQFFQFLKNLFSKESAPAHVHDASHSNIVPVAPDAQSSAPDATDEEGVAEVLHLDDVDLTELLDPVTSTADLEQIASSPVLSSSRAESPVLNALESTEALLPVQQNQTMTPVAERALTESVVLANSEGPLSHESSTIDVPDAQAGVSIPEQLEVVDIDNVATLAVVLEQTPPRSVHSSSPLLNALDDTKIVLFAEQQTQSVVQVADQELTESAVPARSGTPLSHVPSNTDLRSTEAVSSISQGAEFVFLDDALARGDLSEEALGLQTPPTSDNTSPGDPTSLELELEPAEILSTVNQQHAIIEKMIEHGLFWQTELTKIYTEKRKAALNQKDPTLKTQTVATTHGQSSTQTVTPVSIYEVLSENSPQAENPAQSDLESSFVLVSPEKHRQADEAVNEYNSFFFSLSHQHSEKMRETAAIFSGLRGYDESRKDEPYYCYKLTTQAVIFALFNSNNVDIEGRGSVTVFDDMWYWFFLGLVNMKSSQDHGSVAATTIMPAAAPQVSIPNFLNGKPLDNDIYNRSPEYALSSHHLQHANQFGLDLESLYLDDGKALFGAKTHLLFGKLDFFAPQELACTFMKLEEHGIGKVSDAVLHLGSYLSPNSSTKKAVNFREKDYPEKFLSLIAAGAKEFKNFPRTGTFREIKTFFETAFNQQQGAVNQVSQQQRDCAKNFLDALMTESEDFQKTAHIRVGSERIINGIRPVLAPTQTQSHERKSSQFRSR